MWIALAFMIVCSAAAEESKANNLINALEAAKRSQLSSCSGKYASLPASTMCQYTDDPRAKNLGVNAINQIVILAEHNKYRRMVRPPAKGMQKMYWDDEIAVIAQKWAQSCRDGHDTNENRKVPGYGIYIGQNWASGFPNWAKAIKAWYDEVSLYRYGQDPQTYLRNGFAEIGHYTQVVRDVAARVGCGYAECPRRGKVYVCNYAFGNPQDFGRPYERGTTCQDCPKSCKKKLCDCHGTICLNGGTLDPSTCTCQCPDLWEGPMCETLSCPASDPEVCGAPWGFQPHKCTEWMNVPEECPWMCGVCKSGDRPGSNSVLPPEGNQNSGNFPLKGQQGNGANSPEGLEKCRDVDAAYCGKPQPLGFEPQHCKIWINVPVECPAMCGRCIEKCPGMSPDSCLNGATVGDDCKCICTPEYKGERCEKFVKCPRAEDEFWCTQFNPSNCAEYYNFPTDCPHMCNAC